MKIIYILNSRMPTERAYGIQVAKMCEALAKLGAEVVLLFPKRDNSLKGQDCFSYYGVEKNFEVKQIFSVDLLKYGFLNIFSFWLGTLSFYCGAFLYILFKMPNFKIVYTRDFYAASILIILTLKSAKKRRETNWVFLKIKIWFYMSAICINGKAFILLRWPRNF